MSENRRAAGAGVAAMGGPAPRLLDVEDAARYLGVARKTLYKWVEGGQVPFIRIGRLVRFRRVDLEAWVDGQARGPQTLTGIGGPGAGRG